jgi:hypothetical protein
MKLTFNNTRMKYIFSALIFLHGAIHLMGFAKAFGYAPIENIHSAISKTSGVFWLLACVLFLAAGIALLAKVDKWYLVSFIAVLLSTFLIISVWNDAKFGTVANMIILAGTVFPVLDAIAKWGKDQMDPVPGPF